MSVEKYGRDHVKALEEHCGAEGEIAKNSQAKEPYFDDTLESKGAPKNQSLYIILDTKDNISGHRTERINKVYFVLIYALFLICAKNAKVYVCLQKEATSCNIKEKITNQKYRIKN